MTIARWKPFGDLYTLQDKITRLFEDQYTQDPGKGAAPLATWYPVTDIYETKEEYVFRLEVPGLNKDDINIEFCDGTICVKGERKEESEVNKECYLRVERFNGSFNRSFTIPKDVDTGKIKASLKEGVLELCVPKAEEKKAKAISITVK